MKASMIVGCQLSVISCRGPAAATDNRQQTTPYWKGRLRGPLQCGSMSRLLVRAFSLSIDGYGAGLGQDLEHPLGIGGPELFDWFLRTRTWGRMHGEPDGETGVDDDFAAQGLEGIGAWILGRNMFGPVRGPWPDEAGKGGGATSRRTTRRFSCSRITRARRWR